MDVVRYDPGPSYEEEKESHHETEYNNSKYTDTQREWPNI